MTTAHPDLATLLAQLLEAAPPTTEGDTGDVRTLDLLHRLAARSSQPLEQSERVSLAMLCRKIAVAGRVWEAYDSAWKRPASRSQLAGPAYALLAAVLLIRAGSPASPSGDASPGPALKYVNAALGALDLARNSGDFDLQGELDEVADRVLAQLMTSR